MMRSLYSGVSGLKSHQTKMDVIGNNIANVNTTAYKSKSINFSDMLYQTTQGASAPNPDTGTAGTDPRQIGLGVKTAAISTSITTGGSTQTTGNPFDLKLTGDAFFVVNDGTNTYFTRDGSFAVDAAGYLAMSGTGYNVMGWTNVAEDGTVVHDTVKPIKVMDAASQTYDAAATTQAYIAGILDKNDKNLATDDGKITTLQIYDKRGYAYNLRLGMKPVTSSVTSTKNVTNTERKYDLPGSIQLVDNSTFKFNVMNGTTVGDELTSSLVPSKLLDAIKTEALKNKAANGTAQTQNVTLNAAFFNTYGSQDELLQNASDLYGKTIQVSYSGGTAYMAYKNAGGSAAAGNTALGIVDIPADTITAIYGALGTNVGTSFVDLPAGVSLIANQKTYSDGTDAQYEFHTNNGTTNTTLSLTYEQLSALMALDGSPEIVSQYTTTEDTTTTQTIEGQYTISLLSMTDSDNKNVDITNLNNPQYNLVYNTADGKFNYVGTAGSNTFTLNLSQLGDNFENLTVDMSTSKNVDNKGSSTISGTSGDLDGNNAGRKIGELTGVSISTDGMIYATYSNSQTKVLGQIAVATFANANGLANVGDNCYEATQNSGSFDGIGVDIKASGTGYMTSGCLEMSNVDLSNEFTNMITTQRGFQANSRIITVSDTLLEELTNLKR